VPTQIHRHERQPPLRMRRPKHARASQRAKTGLAMIRHEELVRRPRLEALRAVPGHVLDHEEGAVGDEDVVEHAVGDDGAVEALDDGGEDGEAAGGGGVCAVDEDGGGGAFLPVCEGWGVDRGLDVAAVEVDGCA